LLKSITANHHGSHIYISAYFLRLILKGQVGLYGWFSPLGEKSVVLPPKEAVSLVTEDAALW